VPAAWAASQYDSFQLSWDLAGPPPYDAPRLAYAEALRATVRATARAIRAAQPAAAGVWTACYGHCVSEGPAAWMRGAPDAAAAGRNVTLMDAVAWVLGPAMAGSRLGLGRAPGAASQEEDGALAARPARADTTAAVAEAGDGRGAPRVGRRWDAAAAAAAWGVADCGGFDCGCGA
jgi:hypothetical protein